MGAGAAALGEAMTATQPGPRRPRLWLDAGLVAFEPGILALLRDGLGVLRPEPCRLEAGCWVTAHGWAWARLGLDIENDFQPLYVVAPEKRAHVAKLRKMAAEADEIILATDDDREGESIAWHLFQELKPRVPVKRMVFHEITKEAIQAAIAAPRQIDSNLVEAQETRRALDRLYGYEVSPVLWKKVAPKLSAGRVQSVATRMLVERERERMRFVSASWWDLLVTGKTSNRNS